MSQQYQQPHYDPTPVWGQPESASPEVVQPLPEQHAPHQHKPMEFGRIPSTPDWEGARRRLNIVWSIAMIIVIVLAVVAGAVGGTFAVKNARDSCAPAAAGLSSSAAGTTTSSSLSSSTGTYTADPTSFSLPLAPTGVQQLAKPSLPCPTGLVVGTYNSSASFKTYCQQSFDRTNLASFIAYDFADCVDACIGMNYLNNGADVCVAVSMAFNLNAWLFAAPDHGNCYLKGRPLSSLVSLQDAWTAVLCKDPKCQDWYQTGE